MAAERRRPLRFALFALALAALFAGCAVGPRYEPPQLATPEAFRTAPAEPSATVSADGLDSWWELFGDPQLDQLVSEALAMNADLREAAARVDEARALAGVARSALFPEVSAGAGASRTRVSTETTALPPGTPSEFDRLRATANVSYELDLWGRLRRQHEAALADLLATEYGATALRVALVAEVARAWFDLGALDRQLAVAREVLGSRDESLRLQQLRFDAGVISELDLAQARAELAATAATIPELELAAAATENRLAVLLGRYPGPLTRDRVLDQLAVPPAVPPGLPSALLVRRPDLAAAEARLHAANARVGVARAAYFPTLSLTGYLGSESQELSGFLQSGTGIWQAAASLVAPIFNAGRISRQVAAARAREEQALASYQQTVQTAFADVETALVARRTTRARREALADQVAALDDALRLAQLRYDAGSSSYLEVLDAQRSLFRVELELVSARRDELAAAANLFAALGGGWERTAAAATPPAAE